MKNHLEYQIQLFY